MSDETKLPAGSVAWIDLTVSDAPGVRDFYKEVVG
ncbi:MAG: VOC family protein, partial [Acidobacteria bacterium]